jgi:hypothetical protein
MGQSISWEAVNSAATKELPSIVWNPTLHLKINKNPPSIHPRLLFFQVVSSAFTTKILYAFLLFAIHATRLAHPFHLQLEQAYCIRHVTKRCVELYFTKQNETKPLFDPETQYSVQTEK